MRKTLLSLYLSSVVFSQGLSAGDLPDVNFNPHLASYIKTLSSDAYQGRMPSTVGEAKSIAYIEQRFRSFGLKPGNSNSYLQAVPLVSITATNQPAVRISGHDQSFQYRYGERSMTWTKRVVEHAAVQNSSMVFVGYGIVAPEYGWNDYAGVDVRGKTVVILVNDPGFATGDKNLFNGRAMTYYGRWTYKYEEAARQGAAMALIVHETDAAGYGWKVVSGSWSGAQFDLTSPDNNMGRVAVEGWLSHDAATRIFRAAGSDLKSLKQQALKKPFHPVALGMQASVTIDNALKRSESHNVVGLLPGTAHADEYFIYTAHWDHLGMDPELSGDQIYNGAEDNASGVGGLLSLAERFAAGKRPTRSIVFLAVTLEESGLLGSRYYAEHPIYPLAQTVGGVNIDVMNVHGPSRDVVVVGLGSHELEPMLAKLAQAQGRHLAPEDAPQEGHYFRSDQFSLAKFGVPMIYAHGGPDSVAHGRAWGLQQRKLYLTRRYHQPADEYSDSWDLSGASQDLFLFFRLGLDLANSRSWPNWYAGNAFKRIRDASRSDHD